MNDHTRKIFKQAIANMFGGEDRIPDSVKTAMLMDDYNCGKPLTARRIMAVKVAIDADGTAKALSQAEAQRRIDNKFGKFESEATKATALSDGFTRAELKNLAKAVNFLRAANPGMTEAEAYQEVSTPHTKANRLFQYGGNFLKNVGNFTRGLQLLDDFAAWHSDLVSFFKNNSRGLTTNFANADTPTKLNANTYFADKPNDVEGLETFVFRDLAAINRLDAAIAHAEKLKEDGRVVSTDDWGKKDVQRMVAGPKPKPLPAVGGRSPNDTIFAKNVQADVNDLQGSLFRRDLLPHIAKPGWFEE